jgi:hypothetical protein
MNTSEYVHLNSDVSRAAKQILTYFVEVFSCESLHPVTMQIRISQAINIMKASGISRINEYEESIMINNNDVSETVHVLTAVIVSPVICTDVRRPVNATEGPI